MMEHLIDGSSPPSHHTVREDLEKFHPLTSIGEPKYMKQNVKQVKLHEYPRIICKWQFAVAKMIITQG
jgi:hypothetical protein